MEELVSTGEAVIRAVEIEQYQTIAAPQWNTSCLNLLNRVFGSDSVHFQEFSDALKMPTAGYIYGALGVFKAAKDDYENGYLFDVRQLIEAEVFDDFLEQAVHLFSAGYHQPAAVIAGSVLEDGLRKLCQKNGITLPDRPKLDQMNADLAKAGVYNKLVQKRITTFADLRNKAAHGQWDQFTKEDVREMIDGVRRFMEGHFT